MRYLDTFFVTLLFTKTLDVTKKCVNSNEFGDPKEQNLCRELNSDNSMFFHRIHVIKVTVAKGFLFKISYIHPFVLFLKFTKVTTYGYY
jgi:hypothetical protein